MTATRRLGRTPTLRAVAAGREAAERWELRTKLVAEP